MVRAGQMGRGWGGGRSAENLAPCSLLASPNDRLDPVLSGHFRIEHEELAIGNTERFNPMFEQQGISVAIRDRIVLFTIELDGQPCFRTIEIDRNLEHGVLPSKVKAQLATP